MCKWPGNYVDYARSEGAGKAVRTRLNQQWSQVAGQDMSAAQDYSRLLSYIDLGKWDLLVADQAALGILSTVVGEISPDLEFSLGKI